MSEKVQDFVQQVNKQDFSAAKGSFESAIAEKISAAFENKKIELASQMAGDSVVKEETENLDEAAQDTWKVEFTRAVNPGSGGERIKKGSSVEVKARNTSEAQDKAIMKLAGISKKDAKQVANTNSKNIKASKVS